MAKTKDTTRILWKLLPGCGKLDHLEEGEACVVGGVRCLPWHFAVAGGWVLARYLGSGGWEAVSHVEYPPQVGMLVVYDDAQWRWDWEDHPAAEESPVIPLDDLLTWLKEIEEKLTPEACSDCGMPPLPSWRLMHKSALEKWGGGLAEEKAGSP